MAEGWLLDCALSKVSGQPRIIDVELLRFFSFFLFSFFRVLRYFLQAPLLVLRSFLFLSLILQCFIHSSHTLQAIS